MAEVVAVVLPTVVLSAAERGEGVMGVRMGITVLARLLTLEAAAGVPGA